jgi:chorismate synthase
MDSFGRLFRVSLSGESHGPAVGVLVDGCPAGIPLAEADFQSDLARRRPGARGTSARAEEDKLEFQSGVFQGRTTGAPILIRIANEAQDPSAYEAIKDTPRPSHADYVGYVKSGGFRDYRGGGHFSGRLTVGLVEAGGDPNIDRAVDEAVRAKDSIGGVVACEAHCVPPGLGEPWFDSAESLLSHILFSIPGVRGVEFGAGFEAARMKGSEHNDPIVGPGGQTLTNNAGGINGGITNGNPMILRVAVKPTPSIPREQRTVQLGTGLARAVAAAGRHDVCIALRVPVIVEAACAAVLADLMLIEQLVPRVRKSS